MSHTDTSKPDPSGSVTSGSDTSKSDTSGSDTSGSGTSKPDVSKPGSSTMDPSKPGPSKRSALARNAVIFQLKLMADGLRDLLLLPISLIAALIGLLRGGDEPEREFNQVLDVGRESEQWINLFGNHEVSDGSTAITSIDGLFAKVEETLKQQYQTGGTSKSVQAEIDKALRAVIDKTKKRQSENSDSKDKQSGY